MDPAELSEEDEEYHKGRTRSWRGREIGAIDEDDNMPPSPKFDHPPPADDDGPVPMDTDEQAPPAAAKKLTFKFSMKAKEQGS